MIATAEALVAKSPRRQVRKATKPKADLKVKTAAYLSADSARRLAVTAAMEGRDKSAILDELVQTYLRKYVVSVRGERPAEASLDSGEDRQDVTPH